VLHWRLGISTQEPLLRAIVPILAVLAIRASADALVIPVYYVDRPPLITTSEDGKIGGSLGERAAQVFAAANLQVRWINEPGSRIVQVLTMNHGPECSFGWYKTRERAAKVVYSLPFFLDPPAAGLIRADYPAPADPSLGEMLTRPDLRLALRQYVVYGERIDLMLGRVDEARVSRLNVDNAAIAKMIHAGRADLTIMPLVEIGPVIAAAGLAQEDFRIVNFRDLSQREYRYIVCAKQVAPGVMQKINKAIRDLSLP
jgi:polar amino acid transport system substrate-binding protein